MALSGSFSGSIKSGNYKLRVDWSATQNVAGNTSKITATMYLVIASGWSLNIAARSGNTTTIAGTSYSWDSPAINKGGSTTKLGTVTSGNIAHNSDGTKSVTISATFKIQATISGTYYDTITASATVTLDTIPRATTPTLSSTSVFMGSSVTITLPRASSSFTHDLAYKFASGSWVAIKNGATTSHAWTVPDLSTSIPNAASGLVTVRCITKNGNTTIGTKTVSLTIKVPTTAAYYPTISAVTLTEATAGLAAKFKAYIQNKSKVKAVITAAGAKGSTIKSISTTFQGSTYTGSTWTSGLLSSSGTLSMTTTVTDSRGRTAKKTTTLSVLAYSTPKITAFDVYRVNDEGDTDTEGVRARVYCAYSVPSLNGGNTAAAVVEYKATTDTAWTHLFTENTVLNNNMNWFSGGAVFDVDHQYDVRLTVTDYFGAKSVFQTMLPSGAVIMDILADGTGIGVGKVAELPGVCDIAMQTFMRGGMMWPELATGTNLDTLLTPGQFRLPSASSYTKAPESGVGAMLEIMGSGTIIQRWTTASYTNPRTYERAYFSSKWGDWVKTSDAEIGKVYTASKSVQITTAGVDTLTDGATLSVPAGTYVITAEATFNTGASTGARNNQIRLLAGSTQIARERVMAGGANYAELHTAAIHTTTATTTLKVQKSSSIAESSTAATSITAVKIL